MVDVLGEFEGRVHDDPVEPQARIGPQELLAGDLVALELEDFAEPFVSLEYRQRGIRSNFANPVEDHARPAARIE